jgi:membrane protease YdiL (CAAX protease family)
MSNPGPRSRWQLGAVAALLVVPYLLNDVANIFVAQPLPWLVCDYGVRLASLACLVWAVRGGAVAREDLALGAAAWPRVALAGAVALGGGLLLNSAESRAAFWSLAPWQWGSIPPISLPWLRLADCFVGVALVAVSEELVFRGALPALLARLGAAPVGAWLISTVLFGLAHWSLGPGHVLQTALIGGLFGLMARYGRSLWPAIVAHYGVDFVEFFGAAAGWR